ncbi:hypothetical protein NEMBOFW57_005278 [Staphylotrichum longicolle]|uniref:Concanavalin A-like lectin/glucanase n=1 Tax=Staphylotrichum longicolle TaxID=669026 RepID=A0AAD4I1C2_9PEZI|nr:hypothetical protein NEMBOFW57_005278 [Staphylotrichum longicolle]
MKSTTLFTLLLTTAGGSAATLPVPLPREVPQQQQQQQQHRLALLHTLPTGPSASPSNFRLLAASSASTESTKGGAFLTLPASSSSSSSAITSARGTFRVPAALPPTAGPTAGNPVGVYAASFWVGIDGATAACAATLRAGVDVFYDGSFGGPQRPFAWYQFSPAAGQGQGATAVGFEGLAVAEGDVVRLTLEGTQKEVVVVAENFGANVTGTCVEGLQPVKGSVRKVLAVPEGGAGSGLCGGEAAWVVEDFPLAGLPDFPVALANFTSVTFAGAGVTLGDGTKRGVDGAEVRDVRLQAQGGRLTSCEVVEGKKVKCTRVVGDN